MTDDDIQLTREQLLAGLGVLGGAAATTGFGTTSILTDGESVGNNSLTAGTLNLEVTSTVVESSSARLGSNAGPAVIGGTETVDGTAVVGFQLSDLKPGDWVILCIELRVSDNPGYVELASNEVLQYESGQTEAEAAVDDSAGGSLGPPLDGVGRGELAAELRVRLYEDYDASHDDDPPQSYVSQPREDLGGTATSVFDQLSEGIILGGQSAPLEVGPETGPVTRYMLFELPASVGNQVQSDALTFDLVIRTEQVRHNESPFDSMPMSQLEAVRNALAEGNRGAVIQRLAPLFDSFDRRQTREEVTIAQARSVSDTVARASEMDQRARNTQRASQQAKIARTELISALTEYLTRQRSADSTREAATETIDAIDAFESAAETLEATISSVDLPPSLHITGPDEIDTGKGESLEAEAQIHNVGTEAIESVDIDVRSSADVTVTPSTIDRIPRQGSESVTIVGDPEPTDLADITLVASTESNFASFDSFLTVLSRLGYLRKAASQLDGLSGPIVQLRLDAGEEESDGPYATLREDVSRLSTRLNRLVNRIENGDTSDSPRRIRQIQNQIRILRDRLEPLPAESDSDGVDTGGNTEPVGNDDPIDTASGSDSIPIADRLYVAKDLTVVLNTLDRALQTES